MKQTYSNVTLLAIIACVAYITLAAAWYPSPTTVSNTESGSSSQGIVYGPSGPAVLENQAGSSQGNAGNFQFSSGEDTLETNNGILSGNGASEGSTGVLSIPVFSPALPQFNTQLPEPQLTY
ncbi:hypothetical protein GAYE_SCF04G2536 [Galdieria yellowstonensis]|uniref:Uncharacterized protein n=1 Tax=Galdieria yellowstonensis TaxID=3028027 RepID=A0AAV9IB31_9RHOD|nr:hypothetical protein GAYE_SCF04G2536 [Galdieria yellowstonensis]